MGNKEHQDKTNLIINYLPPTMSEGTLATLFSPYGLLERCKIVVDLQTLRSRGYGFVKYDNALSAERALTALNGYELNGKKLKVALARPQSKAIMNSNLYITNIPIHYNDNNLFCLFQEFGNIVECKVLLDRNGQSRGVGFVRMDTHHHAMQAMQAMDQYVIDSKHPPLTVKLVQRRLRKTQNDTKQQTQKMKTRNNYHQKRGYYRPKEPKPYFPAPMYRDQAVYGSSQAMNVGVQYQPYPTNIHMANVQINNPPNNAL